MEKKHKLLFRYIEILKDNIDDMFDGLVIEDKEIYSLQTEILDSDGKVHDLKQMIDTFFKRKMVDYLNNKYKLMKDNKFYRNTDYGLFGFEYELIDTTDGAFNLLNITEYATQGEAYLSLLCEYFGFDEENLYFYICDCDFGKTPKNVFMGTGEKVLLDNTETLYQWLSSGGGICDE